MNNLLRIRTLTDKFFEGDTTPEEEQELYDFYRQDDKPEDLRSNCELFRDLAALGSLAPSTVHHPLSTVQHRRWWLAAAAVALLLIVGGIFVNTTETVEG